MKFTCGNCEQRIEAGEEHAGFEVPCPSCEVPITIPSADEDESAGFSSAAAFVTHGGQSIADLLSDPGDTGETAGIDLDHLGISPENPDAKYMLGEELARGGMGAVLVAHDLSIRREVAMKQMLDPAHANREEVLRFVEEAQITGQLEHPGIVPVHELGIDGEGRVFYTMKRIQGDTLKTTLSKIRKKDQSTLAEWPLARLLRVFISVCDAIAFAHSRGVIHRDLKPANIMLGEFGEVLVVDWGIAKLLGRAERTHTGFMRVSSIRADDNSDELVTLVGTIVGTPNYMAPEQARGDAAGTDERTDIFQLGAILYEILSLGPPIIGKNIEELLGNAETATFVDLRAIPPSAKRPHCPAIPNSLAAVCNKAMAMKKGLRYAKVSNLREDVENYVNGFATAAEGAGTFRQIRLFVRRHKAMSIALAALTVVLITGVVSNISEQRKRASDRQKSVPALVQTAKGLMQIGEWDQARIVNNTALDFDEKNRAAHLQKAMLFLQSRDFKAAADALEKVGSKSIDESNRNDLIDLATAAHESAGVSENELPVKKIADAIDRLNFPEVALGFRQGRQEMLEGYLKKISADWGPSGPRTWILRYEDERLLLTIIANNPKHADLKPLVGVPIEAVIISGITTDLSPLGTLKTLTELTLKTSAVSDVSPLRGTNIEVLDIANSQVRDLSPLAEITRLRELNATISNSDALLPLTNLPLEQVEIAVVGTSEIGSFDLSVFETIPVRNLKISITSGNHFVIKKALNTDNLETLYLSSGRGSAGISLKDVVGAKTKTVFLSGFGSVGDLAQPNSLIESMTLNELRTMRTPLIGLGGNPVLKSLHMQGYSVSVNVYQIPPSASLEHIKIAPNGMTVEIPERKDFPKLKRFQVEGRALLFNAKILYLIAGNEPIENEIARLRAAYADTADADQFDLYLAQIGDRAWRENLIGTAGVFEGHRYLRLKSTALQIKDWHASRAFAESLGGHLVTVESEAEQDWLSKNFMKDSSIGPWLGLIRTGPGNPFQWVFNRPLEFSHWGTNQPGSPLNEAAAVFGTTATGYLWEDATVDAVRDIIIEWDE